MFPLDFEEFLYANGMNEIAISAIQKKFERLEALDESMHSKMMDLFRKFLLVGGLPDAVNSYIEEKNIQSVREIQSEIHDYYAADASKYDEEKKLKIRRIYDLIPSNMENRKKRVVAQSIENKKGKTFNDYEASLNILSAPESRLMFRRFQILFFRLSNLQERICSSCISTTSEY